MLLSVLMGVVIAFGGLVVFGFLFQGSIIFPANRDLYRTPRSAPFFWDFEDVTEQIGGETTHGWFVPVEAPRGTVLFSHGNGECIANVLETVGLFRDKGFNVLVYDYGGYGRSSGNPSEWRCYADIRVMWKYLTQTRGLSADSIVLHGRSLGGGVAADLAAEVTPAAVILESTFLSVPRMAAGLFPFSAITWLIRHRFDTEAKIGRITAPMLIIHSPEDDIVPESHGRRLFELAATRKEYLQIRGSHNTGAFESADVYAKGVSQFLDSVFEKVPAREP